ncbi:hypothetical protein [Maribacter aestuarii]|uniref:hypothetical protein n=1 Tax=Maribacter aestuarii TaxID=1130723 RepID=UPI00248B4986|nr:hypothetical protein [Maribacter aestuarii]
MSYRMHQSGGWEEPDTKLVGENHPNGTIINYYLQNLKDTDSVQVDIMEMDGTIIQTFSNTAKENKLDPSATKPLKVEAGGNRLIWDMRYPGFKTFEGMVFYSSPNVGPKAVPGNYKARLSFNGDEKEQEFTIVKDPRLDTTQKDYQEQFDFLMEVRNQVSRANEAITNIRMVQKDLDYLKEKTKGNKEMKELIAEFESKLSVIENNIHMTKNQSRQDPLNYGIRINNRLAFLMADSQRGDYPPTEQAKEFFKVATAELDVEINSLNALMQEYIETINNKVQENQIKMISSE